MAILSRGWSAMSSSLFLRDAGFLDDVVPFREVSCEPVVHLLRRAAGCVDAEAPGFLLDIGLCQGLLHSVGENADDLGRSFRRRRQTVPARDDIVRETGFLRCWDILEQWI